MIKSLSQLLSAASLSKIDALSRQAADLSIEDVCQTVAGHVEGMTFSEARGYVRARAMRAVRKQSRLAIARHPGARLEWLDTVARAATERLVPLVLRKSGVGVPQSAHLRHAA
ncbi:MAG: hypothetical protein AAGD11_16130 [Planctomycetota bacterium]